MNDDPLVLVAVPKLILLLIYAEKAKGSPLTQAEVEKIRDECTCITMPYSVAMKSEENSYSDISLENAWEDWQEVRHQILGN